MAVAFDAVSNSGTLGLVPGNTITWNHTCTGSNGFLGVDVGIFSVGASVTGITYNGVALSLIVARTTVTALGDVECWGLKNPTTGTNAIVVTLSASGLTAAGEAVSYTGVHQTTPTEAPNSNQATNVGAANPFVDITTITDQDWVKAACIANDTSITANQTSRNNLTDALSFSLGDEDTGPMPVGVTSMSYTGVGAGVTWAIAGYGIVPAASDTLMGQCCF